MINVYYIQTKPNQIKNNIIDYINEVLNETVEDDEKQNLPEDWEEGACNHQSFHIPFCHSYILSTNVIETDLNSYQFVIVSI